MAVQLAAIRSRGYHSLPGRLSLAEEYPVGVAEPHPLPLPVLEVQPQMRSILPLLIAAVVALGAPAPSPAQSPAATAPPPAARPEDVRSPEAIIDALYDVISGSAGQARDWDRFRSLFVSDARLIPTGRTPTGESVIRVLNVSGYIDASGPYLEREGFFEREVAHRLEQYGSIAHAFSTYESRHRADDPEPFVRGINSIQLYHDGKRWWVVTVLWDAERPGSPIPQRYLRSEP